MVARGSYSGMGWIFVVRSRLCSGMGMVYGFAWAGDALGIAWVLCTIPLTRIIMLWDGTGMGKGKMDGTITVMLEWECLRPSVFH